MTDHMHVDDPAVAAILAAAAAPAEGPVPGEAAALAVFRSVHHPHRRFSMARFSDKAKLIAAAVFGGVVVISGAATAATGGLPLVSHGHSHSTPQHSSDNQGDDQGDDTGDDTGTTSDTNTNDNNGQGSSISDLAKTTAPGPDHGRTVCTQASGGKCHSGGQSDATTHGKAHQNTTSSTHRQNTATTHGKAGANTTSSTHRQNDATTHGKAAVPHGKSALPHGKSGQ